MRAQALVEFALILPVFLLLILGSVQVHSAFWQRDELAHAVRESAIAGATSEGDRCGAALAALAQIYRGSPQDTACQATAVVEVSAAIAMESLLPLPWTIRVTERAVIR